MLTQEHQRLISATEAGVTTIRTVLLAAAIVTITAVKITFALTMTTLVAKHRVEIQPAVSQPIMVPTRVISATEGGVRIIRTAPLAAAPIMLAPLTTHLA